MKQFILLFFTVATLSCGSKPTKEVERVSVHYETINDSIYTQFPGTMLVSDTYIYWTEPFGTKDFVHVIDLKTKKEIATMGQIGQGPREFETPVCHSVRNNRLLIYDLNTNKEALFNIDSLTAGGDYYIPLPKADNHLITGKIEIDDQTIISLTPSLEKPFRVEHKGIIVNTFGSFPVPEPITNGYNHFQGHVEYNEKRDLLVYYCTGFRYLAVYKRINETAFELQIEKKGDIQYSIVDGELKREPGGSGGVLETALTKDFIVALTHDYEVFTPKKNAGRDVSQLPRAVYLYDYEGNLKKILILQVPTLRIAGNSTTNDLYAVIVDEEFKIVKIDLDHI